MKSKPLAKWVPAPYVCVGCGKFDKSYYAFTRVRYMHHDLRFCLGRGSTPKAACVRSFAERVRVCPGCHRGVVQEGHYGWPSTKPGGVRPGSLCDECSHALDRGREALEDDKREEQRRKDAGVKIWALCEQHFKGYVAELAHALSAGEVWGKCDPSAPEGARCVVFPGNDPSETHYFQNYVLIESAHLNPEHVVDLKKTIDALLEERQLKGFKEGNNLLANLANGRYTAPEYDDSQERAEQNYKRNLRKIRGEPEDEEE